MSKWIISLIIIFIIIAEINNSQLIALAKPTLILSTELDLHAERIVRESLIQKILDENNFNERIAEKMSIVRSELDTAKGKIDDIVRAMLKDNPQNLWIVPVQEIASKIIK
ncbi:hypothetical protein [Paenibacillus taichungensis]|uniref:hypothetical protein n=1 Tax=Paenibacillus taichungensis TaxID=484184 RepID=UPI0035E142C0